jgi:hypothetical protein
MTTMGAMITEIEDDTLRSDTAAIRSKIKVAIRQHQKTRFWFNESRSVEYALTAGTSVYTFSDIGTEFYDIDAVELVDDDGIVFQLDDDMSYTEIEGLLDTGAPQSQPTNWAYVAGSLSLWPVPDQAYTLRVLGHVKLAAPTSDDETNNSWMTEAYDLIMAETKAELYAQRWEDPQNAAVFKSIARGYERTLLDATAAKISTSRFTPTEF